jgi:predicted DNA-binding transcriptional regulator AlpA
MRDLERLEQRAVQADQESQTVPVGDALRMLIHELRPFLKTPRWLTTDEVAEITGLSRRWLWDHADTLPFARRVNSKVLRWDRKGLFRWMESRKTVNS